MDVHQEQDSEESRRNAEHNPHRHRILAMSSLQVWQSPSLCEKCTLAHEVNIYVLDENEKCKIKTKKTPTTHANNNDGKTDVGSWREKQKKKKQTKLGACERHTVEVGARGGLKL